MFGGRVGFLEAVVAVALVVLLLLLLFGRPGEVVAVQSRVDGRSYIVQNLPDKQQAADLLGSINLDLVRLVQHMSAKFPGDDRAVRLAANFDPDRVYEAGRRDIYTSYSVNKGEKIVLCLRSRDVTNELEEKNIIMYVAIHELAHLMTHEVGHTPTFWANNRLLLEEAVLLGLYRRVSPPPSLQFLADLMQSVGACSSGGAVREVVRATLRRRFSDPGVCLNPGSLLVKLRSADLDPDLILSALSPLSHLEDPVPLGRELLLWHHKWLCCKTCGEGLCAINSYSLAMVAVGVCRDSHAELFSLAKEIGWATEAELRTSRSRAMSSMILAAVDANNVSLLRRLHAHIGGSRRDRNLNHHLIEAAAMGHEETLRYLHAECGARCDTDGGEALVAAAYHGQMGTLRYLHEVGGVSCSCQSGRALLESVEEGHLEVVKYLHTAGGVSLNIREGSLMVHAAYSDANLHILRYLHEECGMDCGVQEGEALVEAAQNGCLEVVKYLHERGGVDCRIRDGQAMVVAATYGHLDVVRYLHLEGGVDCWVQGGQPVLKATENGFMGVAIGIVFHRNADARVVRRNLFSQNTDSLLSWQNGNTMSLCLRDPRSTTELHRPIDRRELTVAQVSFPHLMLSTSRAQLDLLLVSDVELTGDSLKLYVFPLSLQQTDYELQQFTWEWDVVTFDIFDGGSGETLLEGVEVPMRPDCLEYAVRIPPGAFVWPEDGGKAAVAGGVIPRRIWQTTSLKYMDAFLYGAIRSVVDANPGFQHSLFLDADCEAFIGQNLGGRVLQAYRTVVPGAFKADLWRYCVLYVHGGVYVDCKMIAKSGLAPLLGPTTDLVLVFSPIECIQKLAFSPVYTALIACTPRHPLMRACIDKCTDNILSRLKPEDLLSITGPNMMFQLIREFLARDPESFARTKILEHSNNGGTEPHEFTISDPANRRLLFHKQYPFYYRKVGSSHYSQAGPEDLYRDPSPPPADAREALGSAAGITPLFDPNSRMPWAPGIGNPGTRWTSLHCVLQAAAIAIYFTVAFLALKL
ncbi:hypothetical protein HXX76_014087 [Chlamydomonas incerta]|uniref:Uncharacterized protein n=1 Tax=Chlamydomonas incerta TaxID=51695 RepID=A0A835SDF4_CHLIN|nr:hypothetical protein HXX76_014087 [Chlamydomonas incerta]|eukprot:KAG2424929.1 hypothetical protein HXX76_014087 [Chlamydomonas incerta]